MDMNKTDRKGAGGDRRRAAPGRARRNTQLEPEHLLEALIDQEAGVVPAVLEKLGVAASPGRASAWSGDRRLRARPDAAAGVRVAALSPRLRRRRSKRPSGSRTTTSAPSTSCWRWSTSRSCGSSASRATTCSQALQEVRGGQRVTSQTPETTYQSLEKYGRDLTELRARASSTRSSVATRRFGASSRCSRGGPRTTRC